MSRLTTPLFAALAVLLLTGAASASAATLQLNGACFADPGQRADTITLTGSGFAPSTAYQVTLDGQALPNGAGRTDAAGNLTGSLPSPSIADYAGSKALEHTFTLGIQDGTNTATAQFTVSKLFANFTPSSGNPKTLKVRFALNGFGLSGATNPPIYVHYVQPGGGSIKTYKLGTASGACGKLTSAKRRLFPFTARRGNWKLQFDTSKKYVKGVKTSTFLFYALGVTIKKNS